MPFVSSPDSIRQGKPSFLAVVETVTATGVSLYLAWWTGSINHVVVASIIAPLLLMRIPLSSRFAWHVMVRFLKRLHSPSKYDIAYLPLVLLAIPLAKLYSLFRCAIRHPLNSLEAIPKNYWRNCSEIDMMLSPAVFPGLEEYWMRGGNMNNAGVPIYKILREMIDGIKQEIKKSKDNHIDTIMFAMTFTFLCGLIAIIAILYRYSIKSTALFWLPLIWVGRNARIPSKPYEQIYADLRDRWNTVILVYSSCMAGLFIGKVFLLFKAATLPPLEWMGPIGELTTRLAAPLDLPLWQVASAANAVIAWIIYFFHHRLLMTRDLPEGRSEKWVQLEYACISIVRATLSVYTIFCTLWIAAETAWKIDWPVIHVIVFPWAK